MLQNILMLFRLRTQNFYIYYYQFYYILNIELFQNYNIKNAPISQYILQLFLGAFGRLMCSKK